MNGAGEDNVKCYQCEGAKCKEEETCEGPACFYGKSADGKESHRCNSVAMNETECHRERIGTSEMYVCQMDLCNNLSCDEFDKAMKQGGGDGGQPNATKPSGPKTTKKPSNPVKTTKPSPDVNTPLPEGGGGGNETGLTSSAVGWQSTVYCWQILVAAVGMAMILH